LDDFEGTLSFMLRKIGLKPLKIDVFSENWLKDGNQC
jgi:hypothetical protein